jgi:hypothetical protein
MGNQQNYRYEDEEQIELILRGWGTGKLLLRESGADRITSGPSLWY